MRRFLWLGVSLVVVAILLPAGFGAGFVIADQELPPYLLLRRVWQRIVALAPSQQPDAVAESTIIQTNMLRLRSDKFPWTFGDHSAARGGGGLALLGDEIVGVDRNGLFFHYTGGGRMRQLPLSLQTNVEELQATKNDTEAFRIVDIAASRDGARGELFVAHHYWHSDEQCKTTRVSRLIVDDVDGFLFMTTAPTNEWEPIFESKPCLEYGKGAASGFQSNVNGGRLMPDGRGGLFVSLGDHHLDGLNNPLVAAQDSEISYGKVIRIDLQTLEARVYAKGVRNPQGLLLDRSGNLWETEHGPKGGDELNLVLDQGNYGWPLTTFGTQYYKLTWALNASQGRHEGRHRGYETPVYSWVPSVGISNLIQINGAIERWQDDLLASSLTGRTLFRLRVQDDRVVFAEPIGVGERVRDLVQKADGTIVLWTDTRGFIELSAFREGDADDGAPDVVGACGACHGFAPDAMTTAGPNLWGVYGRAIGSTDYADYSEALRNAAGVWDEEKLRAFLIDPQGVVPGTIMPTPPPPDPETLTSLIAVLRSLR
jgi:cytochrome c2